jgi:hypothetical protein
VKARRAKTIIFRPRSWQGDKTEFWLCWCAAALLERQIAVFCPNIGVLSASVLSLIPLMRPFAWQSLLLPVLPVQDKMLDLLEAPVPFILGIKVSTAWASSSAYTCIPPAHLCLQPECRCGSLYAADRDEETDCRRVYALHSALALICWLVLVMLCSIRSSPRFSPKITSWVLYLPWLEEHIDYADVSRGHDFWRVNLNSVFFSAFFISCLSCLLLGCCSTRRRRWRRGASR